MSLRIRLVLLIVALVTLVALALSALHLETLVNTRASDALDRSTRASQEVSGFLIGYLTQHAGPTPNGVEGARSQWYDIVSTEPDVTSLLVKTMALSRSLVEINVANQDGRILASSSERRVGTNLASLPDFGQWTQGSLRSRLVDLMTGDTYCQVLASLGFKDQSDSVLRIQVVTSTVLLRPDLLLDVERLALVSVGSLLIALLITLIATNFALRPLKRIDQTIDRIVQGNYGGEQPGRGAPKEFAVLESKLNLLGQQFRGARENATELRHDVDQLLERMASQLDVASRLAAISRLTGGVAHEIKNPLNAIALRLDFLRAKLGAPEEELNKDIDVLAKEIARLDRVVKTFLDFSRPVEVHFEDIDLSALTREVADLMTPPARLAHIEVKVETPEAPVVMRGDADVLKQAVLNLVTNAIEAMSAKSGRDGGCLRLTTARQNDIVSLYVGDTGPGIPAAQRDKVFQLYFTSKNVGSGIGLALTYRAVQLHNGTIDFESEEGLGTTFRLQFPGSIRHA